MKLIKYFSLLLVVIMASAIGYAMATGNFFDEGGTILSLPWGIVSMVDLSTGFLLFGCWIWFREGISLKALLWTIGLFTMGFMLGAFYVFWVASRSNNDWQAFFMGTKIPVKTTTSD